MTERDMSHRLGSLPTGKAVRRFWLAWLVLMAGLLAGLVLVVLVAAFAPDTSVISPQG